MIEWTRLATRTGFRFQVRRARPADKAALGRFYQQVTPEDLRFRFLTSLKQVGHDRLVAMTQANNPLAEGFVAFEQDEGPIIAAGMLACDAKRCCRCGSYMRRAISPPSRVSLGTKGTDWKGS